MACHLPWPTHINDSYDNLKDLGLTYKRLKRIAAERDDAYRADWLHNMTSNYTADQLVFLDESSKDDHAILRRYGRAIRGRPAVENVSLNRGVRYGILPALTINGYMAVRAVEGSIDGAEFFDFVLNDVVSLNGYLFLISAYGFRTSYPTWILTLGRTVSLCSTTALLIRAQLCERLWSSQVQYNAYPFVLHWQELTKCLLVFLPPYSPDYNPIEESFSCCKSTYRCMNSVSPFASVKKWLRCHWRKLQNSEFPSKTCVTHAFWQSTARMHVVGMHIVVIFKGLILHE